MNNYSTNAYQAQANAKSLEVWFSGTTALAEGQAVCYDWNYAGTGQDATTRVGNRLNRVEDCDTSNAQWFAGVADQAYSAQPGGQLIRIFIPGSVCNVQLGISTDTVIGVGLLTFDVTSTFVGSFRYAGLPGAGSAIPLQTITNDGTTEALCLAYLMEGPQSGGVEVVTLAADGGAQTVMVGGTTLWTGRSISSGATDTLDDGAIPGLRKKYGIITVELTTSDIVITITSGVTDDVDDVSLDSVTFAGGSTCLNTTVSLYWDGAWILQAKTEDVPVLGGS